MAAALTLAYGIYNVYYYAIHLPDLLTTNKDAVQLTLGSSIQLGVAKVLLFSLLSFAVVWLGRTYRAEWEVFRGFGRHHSDSE